MFPLHFCQISPGLADLFNLNTICTFSNGIPEHHQSVGKVITSHKPHPVPLQILGQIGLLLPTTCHPTTGNTTSWWATANSELPANHDNIELSSTNHGNLNALSLVADLDADSSHHNDLELDIGRPFETYTIALANDTCNYSSQV